MARNRKLHRAVRAPREEQRPARATADTQRSRQTWLLPVGVFLVAAAARAVVLYQLSGTDFSRLLFGDGAQYDQWAQTIASGDWMGHTVFYQSPLYPYLLGIVYALVGRHLALIRILQAVGDSAACVMIAIAARRLFDGTTGWVAGLLAAFYAPSLFFAFEIQKSSLDFVLVSAIVFAAVTPAERMTLTRCAVCGALAGLFALNRENALLLILPVALWCGARSSRKALAAAVVACSAALVLMPVGLRNWRVGGEFHLTTSQFGPNLYIGNNPHANGTYVPLVKGHGSATFEQRDAIALAESGSARTLTPGEVSAYWRARAMEWIRGHPGSWLRLLGKKAMLLLNRTEVADTEDPYTYAESSGVLWCALAVCNFGIVAPLAFLGVYMTWRRWRELWLLYAVAALYLATVLPFFVLDRYRYPVVPVCLVFAGAAVALARRWWAQSDVRHRSAAAIIGISAAVICNWSVESRPQLEAVTNFNIGYELQLQAQNREAMMRYRRAIELDPNLADAHSNLGIALAASGQHDDAIQEYERALQADPTLVEADVNLGIEQAQRGEYAKALDSLTAALALDSSSVDAHYNLGLVLVALGRLDEARVQFDTAIRLDPGNAAARNNLGILLAEGGQFDEAIKQFKAALSIRPDYSEAAANLAHAQSAIAMKR
jgi:tetratricopeptide (TPR) repeat protein